MKPLTKKEIEMEQKTHADYPEFAEDILTILSSPVHNGRISASTLVDELRNSYNLISRRWRFSNYEANYIAETAEGLGFTLEHVYRKKTSRQGYPIRLATYITL
jgi:uncharacterized protein YfkK (UPF0435 family)